MNVFSKPHFLAKFCKCPYISITEVPLADSTLLHPVKLLFRGGRAKGKGGNWIVKINQTLGRRGGIPFHVHTLAFPFIFIK